MWRILVFLILAIPGWTAAREAPEQIPGAMTVNVFQAKQLYDMGAIFVDVRPVREWGWGHVYGAVHLDLSVGFQGLAHPEWPRQVPLVIYCDSEICPSSARAVELAVDWGYQHVFYFRGGYFAWQLADFPQGKGEAGELATLTASR
ncbi:rhodanese-like domain-containing protein [Stutzerimonas urumqiensis]|uniref:rhodanese-like domain-containing protein n=1 Tax=Stutzerimonas urumqiensis TaxID=638269 RepID=UPI003DA53F9A